jgi:hypothetical protein
VLENVCGLASRRKIAIQFTPALPPLGTAGLPQTKIQKTQIHPAFIGNNNNTQPAAATASCGSVPPPVKTPGGTPGEPAGENACATFLADWFRDSKRVSIVRIFTPFGRGAGGHEPGSHRSQIHLAFFRANFILDECL